MTEHVPRNRVCIKCLSCREYIKAEGEGGAEGEVRREKHLNWGGGKREEGKRESRGI